MALPPPHLAPCGPKSHREFRPNNFDLLRLAAATQVLLHHTLHHLDMQLGWAASLLNTFPGVPIFFFMSGMLIGRTYESRPTLSEFLRNRALRIFPALWACLVLTVLSIAVLGHVQVGALTSTQFFLWLIAQASFLQAYNFEPFRNFGTGVANGSLWTIAVELQFYLIVPAVYKLLPAWRFLEGRGRRQLIAAIAAFGVLNIAYIAARHTYGTIPATRIAQVTFLPWLYMFLTGIVAQRYHEQLQRIFVGRLLPLAALHVATSLLLEHSFNAPTGNLIVPLQFATLAATVFSAAYTRPTLSQHTLRGWDISYGIYIYHMPIINIAIYFDAPHRWPVALGISGATLLLATASWAFIEKPAMRRKRNTTLSRPSPGQPQ